jgi:hypothetical protein
MMVKGVLQCNGTSRLSLWNEPHKEVRKDIRCGRDVFGEPRDAQSRSRCKSLRYQVECSNRSEEVEERGRSEAEAGAGVQGRGGKSTVEERSEDGLRFSR